MFTSETQRDWDYLDQSSFRELYISSCGQFSLFVEGVRCHNCLSKIQRGFDGDLNVQSHSFDMGRSRFTANLSNPSKASLSAIVKKLGELGFNPTPLKANDDAEAAEKKAHRMSLYRIGVAGACAGNIMLVAVSLYAGADTSKFREFFEYFTAVLFLPVLFFSAVPFYKNSLGALKAKTPSIDLPIALAIVGGFLASTYHLVWTGGDKYYDSLAVLVFLLLSSRHTLMLLNRHYLSPKYLKSFLTSEKVLTKTKNGWVMTPLENLNAEDEIQLNKGDQVPVDGQLLSEEGYVNSAVLTGESYPERKLRGEDVFAGTFWLGESAEFRVKKIGDATRMGRVFSKMENELLTKTPLTSLTDLAAKYFTYALLGVAIVFLAVYAFVDFEEGLRRSLSLIILACPCALAFATPLAQSLGLLKATKNRTVIKNARALEDLHRIKTIYFDKTGTLTLGQLDLVNGEEVYLSERDQLAIAAIESHSKHPVAYTIAKLYGTHCSLPEVFDVEHLSEGGISGKVGSSKYILKKSNQTLHDQGTTVDVLKNGSLLAQLKFSDPVREESKHTIKKLKDSGYVIKLVTGDNRSTAYAVGEEVGIDRENILFEKSPEEKHQIVKNTPFAMMVGDGVNDSVALAASLVGVSVHGSMQNSLAASDIYLTRSGIGDLPKLFNISTDTFHVVRRNLGFSIAYNLAFGVGALMGFVNPLVAAVLMPISSVTILASTLWGTGRTRFMGKLNTPEKAVFTEVRP